MKKEGSYFRKWWEQVKSLPAPRLDEAFSGGWHFQEFSPTVRINFTARHNLRREVGYKKV